MNFRSLVAGCALAALLSLPAEAAALVNAGLETGDLTGWTSTPDLVEVVTEADDAIVTLPFGEHFTPVEGDYFAKLTAGLEPGDYTILSQEFEVGVTSRLSGHAAFLAFDGLPYDDDAYVRIYTQATNQVLFARSITDVGDYGHTSWIGFTSGVLMPGTYVLEAGVRDVLDYGFSSQLLLDGVVVTDAAIPEPAAWTLMLIGFGALGSALRSQRRQLAGE